MRANDKPETGASLKNWTVEPWTCEERDVSLGERGERKKGNDLSDPGHRQKLLGVGSKAHLLESLQKE